MYRKLISYTDGQPAT